MYRIHFDPKGGFFCLQVLTWGFFWVTVKELVTGPGTPVIKTMMFKTHADAKMQAVDTGLDFLYEERSANNYRDHMQKDPKPYTQLTRKPRKL